MTDSIEKIIAYLRWHDYPFAYEAADRLEALLRDNVVVPRGRCRPGDCDADVAAPSAKDGGGK